MEKSKKNKPLVTVIIPTRNASTTVEDTLRTIVRQTYPIKEIIVVDNVSKDNSREVVKKFAKKSPIKIRLLVQKKDKGVSSSCNWGVKVSKTQLIVFLTSDCSLPTKNELSKLVEPLIRDSFVVATYSTSVLPLFIWKTYNFWEKFFSARMVDNTSSGMVLKFDCVRRASFLQVGGFDEKNFGGDGAIGGEDADLTTRLRKIGQIVRSNANSIHLHYKGNDYSFKNMLKSRKMYARSYARYLRKSPFASLSATAILLTRPLLAILPFLPFFHLLGITLLVFYSFLYSKKMFLESSTLFDPRILLVPFLNIYILYFELFWMITAFLSYRKNDIMKNK